jgi:Zn-dependent peptidase ImmA (M78 family)
MSTVAVNKELISWARERSGLSIEHLLRSFPKFIAWETGDVQPTFRQLENYAKKTWTPLGYFFLQEPPEERLPIPDFRTIGDQSVRRPSPNLMETVQTMQHRQSWMHDFLIEEREESLPFVDSIRLNTDVVEAATRIRQALGLEIGWARAHSSWLEALTALREAVERAGILIVASSVVGNNNHRKLDVEEFRGFVLNDNYAPLIFVNATDYKSAQMFTFAHELAHVWLGESGVFNLRALEPVDNEIERYCNRVAAELLVPESELRTSWRQARQADEPFQVLARQFKVSTVVVARRALDLGFINRTDYFAFYEAYLDDERRKKEKKSDGGDFYNTQNVRVGKRFAAAVIRATKEGRLLFRDAYRLTGLYGNTFDKYASSLGFRLSA